MSGRRNPFEEIERMFNRMSRQFEDELGGGMPQMGGGGPAVDVRDEGGEFVVTVDLPGYDKEDIDVQLRGDKLHVSAQRSSGSQQQGGGQSQQQGDSSQGQKQGGGGQFIRQERSHKSESRTISLPGKVQEDQVSAEYQNGVLTVRLPKQQASGGGHNIDIE